MGLKEKWEQWEQKADRAVALYDEGRREPAGPKLQKLWEQFLLEFTPYQKRRKLEGLYEEAVTMVLNRLYLELDMEEDEQRLWDLCWSVCEELTPEEIWISDYACAIGQLMQKKGWRQECDDWFARYRLEEPDQPVYAGCWAGCLIERGEREAAEKLLEEELKQNPECDGDTLDFYLIAWKLYQQLGDAPHTMVCRQRIESLDSELLDEEP